MPIQLLRPIKEICPSSFPAFGSLKKCHQLWTHNGYFHTREGGQGGRLWQLWHVCSWSGSNLATVFQDDVSSKCVWHPMSYLLSPPLVLAAAAADGSTQVHIHLVLTTPCSLWAPHGSLLSLPGLSLMPQEPIGSLASAAPNGRGC